MKIEIFANLQLLEGTRNQEKSNKDFENWLKSAYGNEGERDLYKNQHAIPKMDYNIKNYLEFIEKRSKLMKSKFGKILQI